jgi:hypothetical protein
MGTVLHSGYINHRYRRRLRRLLSLLTHQREDTVTTLPPGPAQLVPFGYVTVMHRVVEGRPPPAPDLRSGI